MTDSNAERFEWYRKPEKQLKMELSISKRLETEHNVIILEPSKTKD